PDPLPGEPHSPEAEAVDGQVAAQEERAAPGGRTSIHAGVAGGLRTEGRRHAHVNTPETRLVPPHESLETALRRHTSAAALRTFAARRLHACADVKRAGFTPIELRTVVAISRLLAMIAIPTL